MYFKINKEEKKSSSRGKVFFILGCLSCLLAGCINLPKEGEKNKIFYLKASSFSEEEKQILPTVTWQLTIEDPTSDIRLNTDRFVVQQSYAELTYVAGARWVDRLPNLVQQVLVDLFENSGKIQGVGLPIDGLEADYVLLVDVRDFELIVGPTQEVKICLFVKIMRLKDREIVAGRSFEKTIAVSKESLTEVVQAFLQGMNQVGKEIVTWTLTFKD